VNSQLLSVTSVGETKFRTAEPSVAMMPNGQFDVAFVSLPPGAASQIYLARYAFNGTQISLGPLATGLPNLGGGQQAPSIAMDNHGNAVIAYQQLDGNNWDVFASRVDVLNDVSTITIAATPLNELDPSVALGTGGAYVVAYQSSSSVNVAEVSGSNVVFSTQTAGSSRFIPHVSITPRNEFLLAYMTQTSSGHNIGGRFGLL
jgi:hypothetical protein